MSHREPTVLEQLQELGAATQQREPYWLTLTGRTLHHVTVSPPLLVQLYEALEPSGNREGGSNTPGSRPTARVDAIDTANLIDTQAREWLGRLDLDPALPALRKTVGERRAIAEAKASRLLRLGGWVVTERDLAADVRVWWVQARITTGWDEPAWQPANSCPACGERGGLRVRLAEKLASCRECHALWDHHTLGLLADHVRAENDETEEASAL